MWFQLIHIKEDSSTYYRVMPGKQTDYPKEQWQGEVKKIADVKTLNTNL